MKVLRVCVRTSKILYFKDYKMNSKKLDDLDFGLNAEITIKEQLEKVFGELKPKKAKNDPFDFDGDNLVI